MSDAKQLEQVRSRVKRAKSILSGTNYTACPEASDLTADAVESLEDALDTLEHEK